MKKKMLGILLCGFLLLGLTGCGNSSSNDDWQKEAHKQGYYKASNGKWYHK